MPFITKSAEGAPQPEHHHSTPREAILSHFKAAQEGDSVAFKAGLSARLIEIISVFEADTSTLFERWSSLSYHSRNTYDQFNMSVTVARQSTGEKFNVYLVKANESWKIDSLLPTATEKISLSIMRQAMIAAEKNDRLGVIHLISNASLAQMEATIDGQNAVENLTQMMNELPLPHTVINISGITHSKNKNKQTIRLMEPGFEYDAVKEQGHWKIDSQRRKSGFHIKNSAQSTAPQSKRRRAPKPRQYNHNE